MMATLQVAAAMLLIVVTVLLLTHLNDGTKARRESAHDSCELIKGLAVSGTPKAKLSDLKAYINGTSLKNCSTYARTVIK